MKHLPLLFALLFSCPAFSQQKVTIRKDRSTKPDEVNYSFTANNNNHYSVTVLLQLQNARYRLASDQVPAVRKLSGFSSIKLLTLFGATNDPGYSYSWVQGCLNTKPKDVNYLLPLAPGKKTTAYPMANLNASFLGEDPPEDWASFAFTASPGDTVYAARGGTVIGVEDFRNVTGPAGLNYAADVNFVKVEHKDCTIANYRLLKKKSALVQVGAEVLAGDPIGTVANGETYEIGSHLQLIVYYVDLTRNVVLNYRSPSTTPLTFGYVDPLFASAEEAVSIGERRSFTVAHPSSVVFAEMSKREIKKWKKKHQE